MYWIKSPREYAVMPRYNYIFVNDKVYDKVIFDLRYTAILF